jgi:hypothetical protein
MVSVLNAKRDIIVQVKIICENYAPLEDMEILLGRKTKPLHAQIRVELACWESINLKLNILGHARLIYEQKKNVR